MTTKQEAAAGWAVVVTKIMAEHVAERTIRAGGYRVFAPSYKKLLRPRLGPDHKRSGKGEIVSRPLFQGYVFVELHPGQEFGEQLFAGVSRLLRHPPVDNMTGRPKLIPDAVIEALRVRVDDGDFDKLPTSWKIKAEPGDQVRALDGPLESFIGELVSIDDDKMRAVALMSLFGRQTLVTFEDAGAMLEKVEAA